MNGLRIERVMPAPPERVWRALTEPAALAAWFWPASFATTVTAQTEVGGAFRIEGGGMAVSGRYLVVEPPSRLSYTWQWDGDDEQTLVSVELSAMDGGTALTLVHEKFADRTTAEDHRVGWTDCLDRLPPYLDDESHERDAGAPQG